MYNVLRDFGCIGYVCGFIVVLVCYFLGGDWSELDDSYRNKITLGTPHGSFIAS
jgi:hypothetical protein